MRSFTGQFFLPGMVVDVHFEPDQTICNLTPDAAKANEVRSKLERSGLKTSTQTVDTTDGKRTRVRVGPFATKAEADKAAARVKTLGLPAAILTL